jgi:hypothetical protein
MKSAYLVPICYQTWPPQAILVSDWLISKKCSLLKPIGQMNRNLVGSILGRSSSFIDASYQVSFHLARQLQRKRFLEIDQPETRIACGVC